MASLNPPNRQFLKYCQENNLRKVRESLSRGVDVNTVSENGRWSGLTIAAHKNYPELLDILLSQPDIKINQTTDSCIAGYPGQRSDGSTRGQRFRCSVVHSMSR